MSSELTIKQDQEAWTQRQIAALKQLGVSNNVTQADLDIFLAQSKRTGLDPFSNQIYMIGRKQKNKETGQFEIKQTIQVSIDGLRLIAHRVAQQCHEVFSMSDTLWADNSGTWHDVWLAPTPPAAAKVSVKRGGGVFSAVALFKEYAPIYDGKLNGMWKSKPALMIAKCAEALALRKAFPTDLSGIYTDDEMENAKDYSEPVEPTQNKTVEPTKNIDPKQNVEIIEAEVVNEPQSNPATPRLATREQKDKILKLLHDAGILSRMLATHFMQEQILPTPTAAMTYTDAEAILANPQTLMRQAHEWVREQSTSRTQGSTQEGEQK
ncbi:phage recombination protein Bet [Gardnerella vaginalis]|uniref:phage recombination protein Bet n=1 Tax=Gardnerella vaginalis TaxID=2702 RepID=UPI0006602B95|nr:phage recombination protein Bet [Gardnerella vaginalis]